MPPFEYWFTSTTVTLWVAILAAMLSLWVAINSDWQAAVREQNRIAAETTLQRSREETLGAVLDVSAVADRIAYTHVTEDQHDNWNKRVDEFMAYGQQRLKPVLTTAEFANVFAPPNPSAFMFAHAIGEEHNAYILKLTEIAARLRNIALKYA